MEWGSLLTNIPHSPSFITDFHALGVGQVVVVVAASSPDNFLLRLCVEHIQESNVFISDFMYMSESAQ